MAAIRAVLAGELYVSRKMSAVVLRKLLEHKSAGNEIGIQGLSERQLQVFQLLGSGLSSREIADSLHLSVKTIETYRENLKHKLQIRDSAELVRRAKEWVQGSSRDSPPRPTPGLR